MAEHNLPKGQKATQCKQRPLSEFLPALMEALIGSASSVAGPTIDAELAAGLWWGSMAVPARAAVSL
jgi:hypothetical protein